MQNMRTNQSGLSLALLQAAAMQFKSPPRHAPTLHRQKVFPRIKTEQDKARMMAAEEKRERRKARNLSNAAFCNTMKVE